MSVSTVLTIQGSVVATAMAATVISRTSGRPPSPCTRSTSAITQTVSAACTATTGQKFGQASDTTKKP